MRVLSIAQLYFLVCTFNFLKNHSIGFIHLLKKMIDEIELQISEYLYEYPTDTSVEQVWDTIKTKLLSLPHTKKRIQALRQIWKTYKKDNDWKRMVQDIEEFLTKKGVFRKVVLEPFDSSKLKLVTMDFIS